MGEVKFITENFDRYDGQDIEAYIGLGGFRGFNRALQMTPEAICQEVFDSGLQGRGGAAYSCGLKWQQALAVAGEDKYVICNADEGEPCTFKDRTLLQKDPYRVIEGMMIAARAVGAKGGFIYLREEYRHLRSQILHALEATRAKGYLGDGANFDIALYSGAGAYVCGEGSSLIESMEGKSGRPRIKPPFIKACGLFLKPTLVNNVETLACATAILAHGAKSFTQYGLGKSTGTKLISLAGMVKRPGTYEIAFGTSLRTIVETLGGGVSDGGSVQFFQLGGASGRIGSQAQLDVAYTYEALSNAGLDVGSGGFFVASDKASLFEFLKAVQDFFIHESCGKCTPCREGNRQIGHIVDRWLTGPVTARDLTLALRFANIMKACSFCGLGETAQSAFLSAVHQFPEAFNREVIAP